MKQSIALPPTLMEDLSDRLRVLAQENLLAEDSFEWMIVTNGDSDPFDSIILLGFADAGPDPLYVAKVPRMPRNGRLLKIEYDRLSELWSLLGADAAQRLPRPVAFVEPGGQPVLVLSYVKGPSLLKSAGRGFWANEARVLELLQDAARSLRELHERACVPLEQGTGTPCSFDQISERFRTLFSLDRAEETALSEISAELRFRTSKATDQVLIQGDFWHGNLIRRPVSDQLVFIDWQFARWSSDVSIDLYLFPLAASFTAAPYGSAEARATAAAGVLSAWSRRLIPAYLQAYGQPSRYSVLPERDGMLAACVEKAARPALEYGYSHPDDLMWRYLFAELVSWPEENWEAFRQPEAAG